MFVDQAEHLGVGYSSWGSFQLLWNFRRHAGPRFTSGELSLQRRSAPLLSIYPPSVLEPHTYVPTSHTDTDDVNQPTVLPRACRRALRHTRVFVQPDTQPFVRNPLTGSTLTRHFYFDVHRTGTESCGNNTLATPNTDSPSQALHGPRPTSGVIGRSR
jgi:hypothetical protein